MFFNAYDQNHDKYHAFVCREIPGRISNAKTIMKHMVSGVVCSTNLQNHCKTNGCMRVCSVCVQRTYINVVFCNDSALGPLVAAKTITNAMV